MEAASKMRTSRVACKISQLRAVASVIAQAILPCTVDTGPRASSKGQAPCSPAVGAHALALELSQPGTAHQFGQVSPPLYTAGRHILPVLYHSPVRASPLAAPAAPVGRERGGREAFRYACTRRRRWVGRGAPHSAVRPRIVPRRTAPHRTARGGDGEHAHAALGEECGERPPFDTRGGGPRRNNTPMPSLIRPRSPPTATGETLVRRLIPTLEGDSLWQNCHR
eukprot:scaffold2263_cov391-Prasinococcus_capsulatus_cf.AAC.2